MMNAETGLRVSGGDAANADEVSEILEDILQDVVRASEVIRRLRKFERKNVAQMATLHVSSLIDDVVQVLHSEAQMRGIRMRVMVEENLPLVKGDSIELGQVVLNLLMNAFDATVSSDPDNCRVDIRAFIDEGGMVKVCVRDFGTGICPETLPLLFQPFVTTKSNGLGLGLSICRFLVESHHGYMQAENNLDGGATFCFALPIAPENRG
jgi:two-component system sensor kinase FixL